MKQLRHLLSALLICTASPNTTGFITPQTITKHVHHKTLTLAHSKDTTPNEGLNIAIVGAGPSGLLLAHRLLQSKTIKPSITILESRSDPRTPKSLKGRAYALGLGMRGRTAIRTVDETLWQEVKKRGYECERFDLHITPKLKLRLRDGSEKRIVKKRPKDELDAIPYLEPSVLLYQSDLCAALLDELERRHKDEASSTGLDLRFQTSVEKADMNQQTLQIRDKATGDIQDLGPFDIIVGCDGVNSKIRSSMNTLSQIETQFENLPGQFKVVRLPKMPPKMDPTSIHLILPKGQPPLGAFVEPAANKEACILFSRRDATSDPLLFSYTEKPKQEDVKELSSSLFERFPRLLDGVDVDDISIQLLTQKPSTAKAAKCSTYHMGSVVLVGDAAHATGGVTGQGVNSALIDSTILAEELERHYDGTKHSIHEALLSYSQKQVPEGDALYDLSFGPSGLGNVVQVPWTTRVRFLIKNLVDTVFGGRLGVGEPTLQTLLTTSLKPFRDIRRDRDGVYVIPFPSDREWDKKLKDLHEKHLGLLENGGSSSMKEEGEEVTQAA